MLNTGSPARHEGYRSPEAMFSIQRFADRFPKKFIGAERGLQMCPLLIRYFLFRSKLLGIYLHRLCRSDEDRALHDHPWAFISIILTSGYVEHTPRGKQWHGPGSILLRPAKWQHRLELDKPAWTLVIRFRRVREWGFHWPARWIPWQEVDK